MWTQSSRWPLHSVQSRYPVLFMFHSWQSKIMMDIWDILFMADIIVIADKMMEMVDIVCILFMMIRTVVKKSVINNSAKKMLSITCTKLCKLVFPSILPNFPFWQRTPQSKSISQEFSVFASKFDRISMFGVKLSRSWNFSPLIIIKAPEVPPF